MNASSSGQFFDCIRFQVYEGTLVKRTNVNDCNASENFFKNLPTPKMYSTKQCYPSLSVSLTRKNTRVIDVARQFMTLRKHLQRKM